MKTMSELIIYFDKMTNEELISISENTNNVPCFNVINKNDNYTNKDLRVKYGKKISGLFGEFKIFEVELFKEMKDELNEWTQTVSIYDRIIE